MRCLPEWRARRLSPLYSFRSKRRPTTLNFEPFDTLRAGSGTLNRPMFGLTIGFRQINSVENGYPCIWQSNVFAAGFSLVIVRVRVHLNSEHSAYNTEFSLATNACTRTSHRFILKICEITNKFRLAFNRIYLSEPDIESGCARWNESARGTTDRFHANRRRSDYRAVRRLVRFVRDVF